jgi:hypothetical protein
LWLLVLGALVIVGVTEYLVRFTFEGIALIVIIAGGFLWLARWPPFAR